MQFFFKEKKETTLTCDYEKKKKKHELFTNTWNHVQKIVEMKSGKGASMGRAFEHTSLN